MKTTIYLPEDLDGKLDAEAVATGVSKAELIRRAIAMLLARSAVRPSDPLPVFRSGRSLTADQMDDDIYQSIRERAARR
jgi:hypothetical protein